MGNTFSQLPARVVVEILIRVSPRVLNPYVVRSTCKHILTLYDGFMWLEIQGQLEPALVEQTRQQARSWCNQFIRAPVLDALPKGRADFERSGFRVLDLSSLQLVALPERLVQLKSLTSLDLSWCQSLASLPERFDQLDLKELNLYYCDALEMDKEINKVIKMTNLENLDIGRTNISVMPERFEQLKSLTSLNVMYCTKLQSLPERFDQLALKGLNLNSCSALDMDKEINKIVEMKTLENLRMGATNISSLTERFDQLKNLKVLLLAYCSELQSLPERFDQLKNLTELFCPAGDNMPPTLRAQLKSQGCTIHD